VDRLLLVLILAAAPAAAMDAPAWVVAVTASGAAGDGYRPCGGAAVSLGGGRYLTLAEALPEGPTWIIAPGGARRPATVTATGARTTAVLLTAPLVLPAAPLADPAPLPLGAVLWTAGNSFGSIEQDGQVALSRGILSARDRIVDDGAPVRGRGGQRLSTYAGPVLETDAAVNDGNQGGAVLDGDGAVVGLATLARSRERRMGTVVPMAALLADLGLPAPAPARGGAEPLAATAAALASSVVLVQFDRPNGPGNSEAVPRPSRRPDEVPAYERERVQRHWDAYYHQQQLFRTDQPVPALVTGPRELVTAVSALHGDAKHGRVLVDGQPVAVAVRARWAAADLALLVAEADLGRPPVPLAAPASGPGEPVAVVGRHGDGVLSVTTGIVSTAGRRLGQEVIGLLQIDALANYGSLGGAVVDARGLVVGMPILLGPEVDRPWGINSGVALAVDGATIADALVALRSGKDRTVTPFTGLGVQLDREGATARVERVFPGSGAAEAGIQPGDILVRIDGAPAGDQRATTRRLLRASPGDRVEVELRRGGEVLRVAVVIRQVES
jgi:serine protease DegS